MRVSLARVPPPGRTTALAIDPTNTQVIYAGAAEGGVWKTTNGGTTWTPLTDAADVVGYWLDCD